MLGGAVSAEIIRQNQEAGETKPDERIPWAEAPQAPDPRYPAEVPAAPGLVLPSRTGAAAPP
jgi:hypothetical protein